MLVLSRSRKSQEAVVVGACDGFQHILKVTVLDVSGGIVKLGFDIDQAVPVQRWEVWDASAPAERRASLREGAIACGRRRLAFLRNGANVRPRCSAKNARFSGTAELNKDRLEDPP